MPTDIHHLIAAISPETFCQPGRRREVRRAVDEGLRSREPLAFFRAAKLALPLEPNQAVLSERDVLNVFAAPGLKSPVKRYSLTYDALDDSLESLYFQLLDEIERTGNWHVTKLVDTFAASPGSGPFLEMSRRTTTMQKESARLLSAGQTLVRSILDSIDELKRQQGFLRLYEDRGSSDGGERETALLALKHLWLETTDPGRRAVSLGKLGHNHHEGFVGDFLDSKAHESGRLALAGEVGPVQRGYIEDFTRWVRESERDLRVRLEIGRKQLSAQLETLRLHAHWLKPYLKLAQQLETRAPFNAALVTAFNSATFELLLLARREYQPDDDIQRGDLPKWFGKVGRRKYFSVVVVELAFRSAPMRVGTGVFAHRGRVEIKFTSYGLNEEELEILTREIDRNDVGDLLSRLGLSAAEDLESILQDLDKLLTPQPNKQPTGPGEDTNPFGALFSVVLSLFRWLTNRRSHFSRDQKVQLDSAVERIFRSQAILEARRECIAQYQMLKRTLGAPHLPNDGG